MEIKYIGTIEDIQEREDLTLAVDSQDVEHIINHLGNHEDLDQFNGFFVKVDKGDYTEIYAFHGSIPDLHKSLFQIIV